MAPVTPPTWEQAGSYSAKAYRQAMAALLAPDPAAGALVPRGGVKPRGGSTTGLQVSQRATPDRWVTVAAGQCFIPATSTSGGVYICVNDGNYDVQTAASHATLARKDLVVARVYDAIDDTGALNQFAIEVITGTPASSPAPPAVPSQAIALAEVNVNPGTTTVTNAAITDRRYRTVPVGGILPVRSATELPNSPYGGMAVFREDLAQWHFWDNTAWRALQFGSWSSYTPTLTASSTNPSLGSGSSRVGVYIRIGQLVFVVASITFGTSGSSAGSGTYRVSLPVTAKTLSAGYYLGSSQVYDASANNADTGVSRVGSSSGWSVMEFLAAGNLATNGVPWAWANGDAIYLSIFYEAA